MVATQPSRITLLGKWTGSGSAKLSTFLILVLVFLAAAAYDLSDNVLFLGDIDDRLRAVQIRQLLSGKGWYDLTLTGIAMPGPYVSPWSRLVDAPYAAIAWALSHLVGTEQALAIAFNIWPPLLMLAFAWFSAGCMTRLMPRGGNVAPLHAFVAALAMISPALEFAPGRIDHHNLQLVMLAAASYGVLCWSAAGGILTGLALALSATIGLETLPLIAALWSALALSWIAGRPGANEVFKSFSASIAVLSPIATLVFAGPGVLSSVQNDIFSAPYIAAFSGFGLISFLVAIILPRGVSLTARLAALAIPGAALAVLIVIAMPDVLAGPYALIDPITRELWLDRIDQEHSVLLLLRTGFLPAVLDLAIQTTIILCAGILTWKGFRAGRTAPAIVLALGVAAFLANLEAFRFMRFPAAILPLFIPQMLAHLGASSLVEQRKLVLSFASVALVAGGLFQAAAFAMPVSREPDVLDAADFLMNDTCSAADRKAMKTLPAGRYMVTPATGLTLLEQAADGVNVAAIRFHRAAPGMRRMFDALYFSDAVARKAALAPFDYLAFCTYPEAAKALFAPPVGSFFEALLNDRVPEGLIPIPVAGSRHLKLFRIDHARL